MWSQALIARFRLNLCFGSCLHPDFTSKGLLKLLVSLLWCEGPLWEFFVEKVLDISFEDIADCICHLIELFLFSAHDSRIYIFCDSSKQVDILNICPFLARHLRIGGLLLI